MKKNPLLSLMAALCLSLVLFPSCDDDNPDFDPNDLKTLLELPYSNLSVEKQKEKLQTEANNFLKEMEDLNKLDATKVLTAFGELMDVEGPEFDYANVGDVINLADMYNQYTWDASSEEWTVKEKQEMAEFIFPVGNQTGKITAKAVTAGFNEEIVLGYYEGIEKQGSWEYWDDYLQEYVTEYYTYYDYEWKEEYNGDIEIPKQVDLKVYLDDKEVGSIYAAADLKNITSMPSSSEVSLTMGDYSWVTKVTKTSPNKAVSTLKKGSATLLDAVAALSGDVDKLIETENIPTSMSANAIVKIQGSLAIVGTMDIAKYEKELDAVCDNWDDVDDDYEGHAKAEAAAFNDNTELYLLSLTDKDGEKIARLMEKAKKYTYGSWADWETVSIFKFNDNTEVEVDVFFSSGFDTFKKNFEKFINSFE